MHSANKKLQETWCFKIWPKREKISSKWFLKNWGLRIVWEGIQSSYLKKVQWAIENTTNWNQMPIHGQSWIYAWDSRMVQCTIKQIMQCATLIE